MAIRLKVEDTTVKLKVGESESLSFTASEGTPIYPNSYKGSSQVVPSEETQTLPTEGLMLTADIVITPIPSNYGLITWNGSVLTVS